MVDPWTTPTVPVPRTGSRWRTVLAVTWLSIATPAAALLLIGLAASGLSESNFESEQARADASYATAVVAAFFVSVLLSLVVVPLMAHGRVRWFLGVPLVLFPLALIPLAEVNPSAPPLAVLMLLVVGVVRALRRRRARRVARAAR